MLKSKFLLSVIFLGTVSFLNPLFASAATLSFVPSSGTETVGSSFTVSVYVNSQDQAMNAASGVVAFPADKLTVTSVSKAGSVFNLWVQDPSFSNNAGTVNFEGIVLNPGLQGAGKILNINFRVKDIGTASLSFSEGSVLANDGQGTNILKSLGTASFSLVNGQGVPPPTPGETSNHFSILEIKRDDLTNPKVKFLFDASDISGIDHYEVQIDQGSTDTWQDNGSHVYTTPVLLYGNHIISAKAFTRAGNAFPATAQFVINPLEAPHLSGDNKEVISVKGTSKYPNTNVILWLQYGNEQPKNYPTTTDANGNFTFALKDGLKNGTYMLWAQITDQRGAQSRPSEKIKVVVQPPFELRMSYFIIGFLLLLVILLLLLLILLYHSRKESNSEKALHYALIFLQKEIKKQLALLDHNQLSEREKQVSENLRDALAISEFIRKGVKETKEIHEDKKDEPKHPAIQKTF